MLHSVTVMFPPLGHQPLFQCHFVLSWAFFLVPPPESAIPHLLPPPSLPPPPSVAVPLLSRLPPSPTSSTGYLPLCPPAQIQEHCQWELLSSSFFCPLSNNKQRFHKNKNLKYKVSQLQLNTALAN